MRNPSEAPRDQSARDDLGDLPSHRREISGASVPLPARGIHPASFTAAGPELKLTVNGMDVVAFPERHGALRALQAAETSEATQKLVESIAGDMYLVKSASQSDLRYAVMNDLRERDMQVPYHLEPVIGTDPEVTVDDMRAYARRHGMELVAMRSGDEWEQPHSFRFARTGWNADYGYIDRATLLLRPVKVESVEIDFEGSAGSVSDEARWQAGREAETLQQDIEAAFLGSITERLAKLQPTDPKLLSALSAELTRHLKELTPKDVEGYMRSLPAEEFSGLKERVAVEARRQAPYTHDPALLKLGADGLADRADKFIAATSQSLPYQVRKWRNEQLAQAGELDQPLRAVSERARALLEELSGLAVSEQAARLKEELRGFARPGYSRWGEARSGSSLGGQLTALQAQDNQLWSRPGVNGLAVAIDALRDTLGGAVGVPGLHAQRQRYSWRNESPKELTIPREHALMVIKALSEYERDRNPASLKPIADKLQPTEEGAVMGVTFRFSAPENPRSTCPVEREMTERHKQILISAGRKIQATGLSEATFERDVARVKGQLELLAENGRKSDQ